MFGSRSLQLDERWQASRRSFEAWILTSRKVFSEESERKSESSYWLLKSEDNGSGKMAAHVGGECEWCSDGCPVGAKIYEVEKETAGWFARRPPIPHIDRSRCCCSFNLSTASAQCARP
ncbi:uncharacterized protein TNCV_3011381 [Trichonephila clavipes]|nr:uncharacterized protein TNCV_3011381 [Trichonephila clavipes]